MVDTGSVRPRVFISYSRQDMAFADRLEAPLKTHGFDPLIDRTEIYAFEDWPYRSQDWKDWLRYKRAKPNPPLPDTVEWKGWIAAHR